MVRVKLIKIIRFQVDYFVESVLVKSKMHHCCGKNRLYDNPVAQALMKIMSGMETLALMFAIFFWLKDAGNIATRKKRCIKASVHFFECELDTLLMGSFLKTFSKKNCKVVS